MNVGKKDWLYPALAPLIIFVGWWIGMILRANNFPLDFTPGSFVPSSNDKSIALLDASVVLFVYIAAGYLITYPYKKVGSAVWWVLFIVLLMMGAEFGIKVMSMALSLNYDYWVYVDRSLPFSGYVLLPFTGFVGGLLLGGLNRLWKHQR